MLGARASCPLSRELIWIKCVGRFMAGQAPPSRAQVAHFRELAAFVSDETAHRVLMDMAREMEAELERPEPKAADRPALPLPRSLS
jgi:hypothetical protein